MTLRFLSAFFHNNFYFGIGALFMLYGLYRAINRPGMSLVLTVISLGCRGI